MMFEIVFGLLVGEMLLFVFLIIPFPASMRKSILKWWATSPLVANIKFGVNIGLVIVLMAFIESVRKLMKEEEHKHDHAHTDPSLVMAGFDARTQRLYAERNFYLTGFTLFLALVLNRFYGVASDMLRIEAIGEALNKQVSGNKAAVEKMMTERSDLEKKVKELEEKLKEVDKEAEIVQRVERKKDELLEKTMKADTENKKDK